VFAEEVTNTTAGGREVDERQPREEEEKEKCPFKSLQTINPSRDSASYNNNNETKQNKRHQNKNRNKQNKTKAHKTNNGKKTHSTTQHSRNAMRCNAHTKPQNQTKLNFNYGKFVLLNFPLI
jgi:hypothetical protein